MKTLTAVWEFLVDFLVGDAPGILLGVLGIVAATFLLRHHTAIGIPVVLVLTVGVLVVSTYHGRRRSAP
jgi:NhaP-type Na+/H+ and K+/H+ antiporter